MASSKASHDFGGFLLLPVSYHSSQHMIYVRAQSGAAKTKAAIAWPEGRTLFLVNIPPDATERQIVLLFRSCGTVERVVFDSDTGWGLGEEEEYSDVEENVSMEVDGDSSEDEQLDGKKKPVKKVEHKRRMRPKVIPLPVPSIRRLRRTGHTAHVIFLDASSCSRALALASPKIQTSRAYSWPKDTSAPLGLDHYTALYDALRPPLDIILAHANTSIELFDYEQEEKRRTVQRESKYRKGEAIVDEDGFTLVTRGGAYGKAVGGGVAIASKKFMLAHTKNSQKAMGRKNRKNREGKEKEAFYAFQIHEKKRNGTLLLVPLYYITDIGVALIDLKRKWEEDKAEVEKLKASRKFKPY
jgi:ribosomal RNA-processing protein 7